MPPRGIRKYIPQREKFAHGYTEAKHAIVGVAIVGEVLQGGLVFGWNALALMLQRLGNFAGKCADVSEGEPLAFLICSAPVGFTEIAVTCTFLHRPQDTIGMAASDKH